ncbi:MAG: ion channel [Candidatus Pristimantibacillus sp.]
MILFRRLSLHLLRLKRGVLIGVSLLFVICSATLAYLIEPDTFHNWYNALYWVMTTMATVGYGDFYMTSTSGKTLTMFLYLFGIGLLSLVIGKIIDSISQYHKKRGSGKLHFQGKQHIIIINWSKKAEYAIDDLRASNPNLELVIIDECTSHPYDQPKVHFVSGDPTSEETLLHANIKEARSAIVFADSRIDVSSLVDGKSLLIVSSIESIAPSVHTTVEIMLEKHIQNFKHINVNDFVLSHDAVSRLAVRSALHGGGNIEIFTQLLSRLHGADIIEVPVQKEWNTYEDAFHFLLKHGATLIADRGDIHINLKLQRPIPADAKLFVMCDLNKVDLNFMK